MSKKLHVREVLEVVKDPSKLIPLSKKYPQRMFEKKLYKAILKGYINPKTMMITKSGQELLINMRKGNHALNRLDKRCA